MSQSAGLRTVAVVVQPTAEFLDRLCSTGGIPLENDDGTNALTFVHEIEGGVDVFQRHGMGHHAVQFDLALEIVFHVAGQLTGP